MGGAEGQVVLVTGGGSGLGRAIVERFYAEGARVVVLDRARRSVESAVEGLGDRVFAVEGDVSRYEDNQRAVSSAVERFGKLDAFIGNAGVFDYGLALADIPERRLDAAFDEVFATNVKGYLFGVRAALPALVRSRGSVVLTLSSASAHAACGGILYTASKHAAWVGSAARLRAGSPGPSERSGPWCDAYGAVRSERARSPRASIVGFPPPGRGRGALRAARAVRRRGRARGRVCAVGFTERRQHDHG